MHTKACPHGCPSCDKSMKKIMDGKTRETAISLKCECGRYPINNMTPHTFICLCGLMFSKRPEKGLWYTFYSDSVFVYTGLCHFENYFVEIFSQPL